jgi:hypothetical protein
MILQKSLHLVPLFARFLQTPEEYTIIVLYNCIYIYISYHIIIVIISTYIYYHIMSYHHSIPYLYQRNYPQKLSQTIPEDTLQ